MNPMSFPKFATIALAAGWLLSGCLSSVVDSPTPVPRVDSLAGTWRVLGRDSGFQYQFLDSTRLVVQRPASTPTPSSSTVDTLPISFEPGGFFFGWRYQGEIGRQYCFRKRDTLIFGIAARGDRQEFYARVPNSWRSKRNPAFGMWESVLCPSITCLLDTLVIDSNSTMFSKRERDNLGTDPYPLAFQDEVLTVFQPASGTKTPLVHHVRNDTLWILEGGVRCDTETEPCLPSGRRKLLRR